MTTIKVTGPRLNNWFAEKLVEDHGPDGARERTSGPMREAVEAVIAQMARAEAEQRNKKG